MVYLLQWDGKCQPPTLLRSFHNFLDNLPPWSADRSAKDHNSPGRPRGLTLFHPPDYVQEQFRRQICPRTLLNGLWSRSMIRSNVGLCPVSSGDTSNPISYLPQLTDNAFKGHLFTTYQFWISPNLQLQAYLIKISVTMKLKSCQANSQFGEIFNRRE